ncbi:MAG: MucR family transcriptional regulator [Magnetococcales bacterium]|nr:MucR family transcriptional regulator [Magnetococcales bacterium]MBF0152077.1 MucR family transcriptional regulator [Magnetococcales bacterium]
MSKDLIEQTVNIVTTYLYKNEVGVRDLEGLIKSVFTILQDLANGQGTVTLEDHASHAGVLPNIPNHREGGTWEPVVPLEDAVTRDAVVCLICGKRGKALKGHLTRSHKMRLDEYRKAFNLPKNFRMVAPSYSEKRRQLAIDAGLGEKLSGGGGGKGKDQ